MSENRRGSSDPGMNAEWLAMSDALIRGVGHAMNNRVAALSALVQVLTSGGQGGPLFEALNTEANRLLQAVELMRLLPRRWDAEPEPVLVGDAVRAGLDLLPLHADFPELSYHWDSEGDLPPVLTEPSLLVHTLCLMGGVVAGAAVRLGARTVEVRGRTDGRTVTVRMSTGGSDAVVDAGLPVYSDLRPVDGTVVERLARLAGGSLRTVEDSSERFALDLELPTLAEARSREEK